MKAFIYIFLLLFAIIAIPTASYADGDDDDEITDSTTDTTTVIPSKLEMPNAFSPNNDGFNDEYQAKSNYQNITEFRAMIFNRWGQCLYTWTDWTDPKKGWDGTYYGSKCKEGVYFVIVKARGADGREYNIRKDVNLLRHYSEGGSTSGK